MDASEKYYTEGGNRGPERRMLHVIPYMMILARNFRTAFLMLSLGKGQRKVCVRIS